MFEPMNQAAQGGISPMSECYICDRRDACTSCDTEDWICTMEGGGVCFRIDNDGH